MSDHLTVENAERASELHKELRNLSVYTTRSFFRMGEIMKEIRDKNLWVAMDYDSFEAYYSDAELSYSRSSVYHAISLAERFPGWRKMPSVPIRKLIRIAPHINDDTKEELLKLASGLSSSDLDKELHDRGYKDADPRFRGLPKIYRCNNCNGVKGVFHQDLCTCGWTKEQLERLTVLIKEVEVV